MRSVRRWPMGAMSALGLLACQPGSYRPSYGPLPGALHVEVRTSTDSILLTVADSLRAVPGVQISRLRLDEGYLETAWYDTLSRASGALKPTRLPHLVRLRFWSDPSDPDVRRVTGEAVRVLEYDPSRPERSLERLVPDGHFGQRLVSRILEALREPRG